MLTQSLALQTMGEILTIEKKNRFTKSIRNSTRNSAIKYMYTITTSVDSLNVAFILGKLLVEPYQINPTVGSPSFKYMGNFYYSAVGTVSYLSGMLQDLYQTVKSRSTVKKCKLAQVAIRDINWEKYNKQLVDALEMMKLRKQEFFLSRDAANNWTASEKIVNTNTKEGYEQLKKEMTPKRAIDTVKAVLNWSDSLTIIALKSRETNFLILDTELELMRTKTIAFIEELVNFALQFQNIGVEALTRTWQPDATISDYEQEIEDLKWFGFVQYVSDRIYASEDKLIELCKLGGRQESLPRLIKTDMFSRLGLSQEQILLYKRCVKRFRELNENSPPTPTSEEKYNEHDYKYADDVSKSASVAHKYNQPVENVTINDIELF